MPNIAKIDLDRLAERTSQLPVNRMVYIYGKENISEGETYGLMVTDAFETRMYLLCYLGYTHCKSVSCDGGMEHTEEVSAIKGILSSAWEDAGLIDYYIDESQWTEKAVGIDPSVGCGQ